MWNLLSCTGVKSIYKPTSLTQGGVMTNATFSDAAKAYDSDNATSAIFSRTSSGTAGVADESTAVCAGFASLAKANINYLELAIIYRMWAQTGPYSGVYNKYSSSGGICEYSTDAGSTWTILATTTTIRYLGSNLIGFDPYTAAVNTFTTSPATYGYGTDTGVVTLFPSISPVLLSVGLQSLQVRFRINTIKDSVAGFESTVYCYPFEITAYVS